MKKHCFSFLVMLSCIAVQAQEKTYNLLVGTYTNTCDSNGIYVYDFDSNTGDFNFKNSSTPTDNPSYLSVSKNNDFIYSVNELGSDSKASAFSYQATDGAITFLNSKATQGADPCYLINDDENVITANYSGGSISVFSKNNDGSLGDLKQSIKHIEKGINKERQEASHIHMVEFSPDKKFVLATNLGNDKLYSYAYDAVDYSTPLKLVDSVAVAAGSGPRHFTFSKDGATLYLVNELNGSLNVYDYNNGHLKSKQTTSIISKGFKGKFTAAAIITSHDGKFLYVTNRGEANTISTFEIVKNGKLKPKGESSTLGNGPRSFAIDPSGNYLLIAHQYTNNIMIFKRNKITGELTDTGKRIELCSPVCLVFTEQQ